MSRGPESNFWQTIRQNLPEKCFATRIENVSGGGVPDAHFVWDGLSFWFELKVSKSNAVNLRPHQVAWNMAYWVRGGANFILVKRAKERDLLLFDGDQGPLLAQGGISAAPHRVFGPAPCLDRQALRPCALRPCALEVGACALRPCALRWTLFRPTGFETAPSESLAPLSSYKSPARTKCQSP